MRNGKGFEVNGAADSGPSRFTLIGQRPRGRGPETKGHDFCCTDRVKVMTVTAVLPVVALLGRGWPDYLRLMPKARLVALPGAGHLPHEEAPRASLPVLRAFLEG